MVAADLVGGKRLGHFHVRVGDDRQIVPERFERRDAGRAEVEVTAQAGRAPQVQLLPQRCGSGGTVYVLDANQPRTIVLGQDTRAEPARRNHGVEEGERDSPRPCLGGRCVEQCDHRSGCSSLCPLVPVRALARLLCPLTRLDCGVSDRISGGFSSRPQSCAAAMVSFSIIRNASLITIPVANDEKR